MADVTIEISGNCSMPLEEMGQLISQALGGVFKSVELTEVGKRQHPWDGMCEEETVARKSLDKKRAKLDSYRFTTKPWAQ